MSLAGFGKMFIFSESNSKGESMLVTVTKLMFWTLLSDTDNGVPSFKLIFKLPDGKVNDRIALMDIGVLFPPFSNTFKFCACNPKLLKITNETKLVCNFLIIIFVNN